MAHSPCFSCPASVLVPGHLSVTILQCDTKRNLPFNSTCISSSSLPPPTPLSHPPSPFPPPLPTPVPSSLPYLLQPLSPPYDATQSATSTPVDCDKPLCSDMQQTQSTLGLGCLGTEASNRKCYYGIAYGDGSTTEGFLVQDQLHYKALDGTNMQMPFVFG